MKEPQNQIGSSSHREEEIDLAALFFLLWRSKWLILVTTFACAAIGLVVAKSSSKVYVADSLIQSDQKADFTSGLLSNLSLVSGAEGFGSTKDDNHEALIKSRLILGKTVDEFGLQTHLKREGRGLFSSSGLTEAPSISLSVPSAYFKHPSDIKLTFTANGDYELYVDEQRLIEGKRFERFESKGYSIRIDDARNFSGQTFNVSQVTRLAAIDALNASLSIKKEKTGGFYRLTITGLHPDKIERLLDNVVDNFLRQMRQTSSESIAASIRFIESQLPDLLANLEKSENALNEYMNKNHVFDLNTESKSVIKELSRVEVKLAELAVEEKILAQRYTRQHPRFKALLSTKRTLASQKDNIINQLDNMPSTQQGLLKYKREIEVNQGIYLQLQVKLQEAKVLAASNSGNVRVIDRSVAEPTAIKPKTKLIVLAAAFLGAVLSSLFVMANFFIRKRIRGIDDVTDATELAVMATVPFSKKQSLYEKRLKKSAQPVGESSLLAAVDPDDLSIEALRGLCTNLHFVLSTSKNKALLISGPTEDVGKSFVSLNLAILFAEIGKKVLIIDSDFRKSYLEKIFGPRKCSQDIADWMAGQDQNLDKVVQDTAIDGVSLLPKSQMFKSATELLKFNRLEELIRIAEQQFDLVIIDSAPILPVSDASIIGRYVGNVALVVRSEMSTLSELEHAVDKLNNNGIPVSGVIINGFKEVSKYSNYYRYGDS